MGIEVLQINNAHKNYENREILEQLRKVLRKFTDKTSVLNTIGNVATKDIIGHFNTETDSHNKKWVPSQRAIKQNGKTLTDKGKLRSISHNKTSDSSVLVGTSAPYGIYHDQARGQILREWLYISKEGDNRIRRVLDAYFKEGI